MLLACSGDAGNTAVEAMDYLLQEGAVPDTWAPNGSSVMLHITTPPSGIPGVASHPDCLNVSAKNVALQFACFDNDNLVSSVAGVVVC